MRLQRAMEAAPKLEAITDGDAARARAELVTLKSTFNRHLVRVMDAMPSDVGARSRARHNLHQVAFVLIPETSPTTLDYFMDDYVVHLEHHLQRIFEPIAT